MKVAKPTSIAKNGFRPWYYVQLKTGLPLADFVRVLKMLDVPIRVSRAGAIYVSEPELERRAQMYLYYHVLADRVRKDGNAKDGPFGGRWPSPSSPTSP